MTDWIDAHSHWTDDRIEAELETLLDESAREGITRFVLGGISTVEWEKQKSLVAKYPGVFFPSFGLHPWWVASASPQERVEGLVSLRAELSRQPRACIAIGETGLDHHPRFSEDTHTAQAEVFREHLGLALEHDLPLVLHVVRAHEAALEILRERSRSALSSGMKKYTGIVHSFSGDPATAQAYLELGFTLSISAPVLTRHQGSAFEKLRQTMVTLSATEFVIETDSPDQPPAGETGLNSPLTLLRVADEIASLRHTTREAVLNQSRDNLRKVFRIP